MGDSLPATISAARKTGEFSRTKLSDTKEFIVSSNVQHTLSMLRHASLLGVAAPRSTAPASNHRPSTYSQSCGFKRGLLNKHVRNFGHLGRRDNHKRSHQSRQSTDHQYKGHVGLHDVALLSTQPTHTQETLMAEDLMSYTMSQGPRLCSKYFRNDTASAVAGVTA